MKSYQTEDVLTLLSLVVTLPAASNNAIPTKEQYSSRLYLVNRLTVSLTLYSRKNSIARRQCVRWKAVLVQRNKFTLAVPMRDVYCVGCTPRAWDPRSKYIDNFNGWQHREGHLTCWMEYLVVSAVQTQCRCAILLVVIGTFIVAFDTLI